MNLVFSILVLSTSLLLAHVDSASVNDNSVFLKSNEANGFLNRAKRSVAEEIEEYAEGPKTFETKRELLHEMEEARLWLVESVKECKSNEEIAEYFEIPGMRPPGATTKSWWGELWDGIKDFFKWLKDSIDFILELLRLLKCTTNVLENITTKSSKINGIGIQLAEKGTAIATSGKGKPYAAKVKAIGKSIQAAGESLTSLTSNDSCHTFISRFTACGENLVAAGNDCIELWPLMLGAGEKGDTAARARQQGETIKMIGKSLIEAATYIPCVRTTATKSPDCGVSLITPGLISPKETWPCQYTLWVTFAESIPFKWDHSAPANWVGNTFVGIENDASAFNGKIGVFNGSASLRVPYFKDSWFRSKTSVYARFRVKSGNSDSGLMSVLDYGGCQNGTSLYIGFEGGNDEVNVKANLANYAMEIPFEFSFFAKKDVWIQVYLHVDGYAGTAELTGTVNCVPITKQTHSFGDFTSNPKRIKSTSHDLYLGDTGGDCGTCCDGLFGDIDLVTLRTCSK